MRYPLYILLLLCLPIVLKAQPGEISGRVFSSQGNIAMEYVNVFLRSATDKSTLSQEVTNKKGEFKFAVKEGTYIIEASFIGFDKVVSAILTVDKQHLKIVRDLTINVAANKLEEVVITSKKQLFTNAIDRKVYNTELDLSAQSGSASEVLQNVPLVQVDIDGNVSLRNAAVTILINGKVSPLMGKNAAAALQQLPANSIAKIEVITNPSAKYKPDGTGGIINIVLKKNLKQGFNGGIIANTGNNDRYNASTSLNYNPGKFNIFGNYSIKKDYRLRLSTNDRTQTDQNGNVVSHSFDDMTARSRPFSNTASLGAEMKVNDQNTIGISGNYYFRSIRKNDLTAKLINTGNTTIGNFDRIRTNYESETEADMAAFFEHNFKKEDEKLRIEFNIAHSPEVENNRYTSKYRFPVRPDSLDNTIIKQTQNNKQLTIAYENPVGKDAKLELGYDGQYNKLDMDFFGEGFDGTPGKFVTDAKKTNRFIYNENVHAVYGTIEKSWKKFGIMFGLRGEFSDLNSHLVTNNTFIPNNYFKVYPTVHLTEKLSENKELQLNYSRRVNRPEGDDLNPFAEYTDPANIRVGNPYLLPEIIHSVEIGMLWKNDVVSILPGVYYRYKYNGFTSVTTPLNATTLITTQQNLSSDQALGADVVFSASLMDKLNINFTPNAFYNQIDASNLGFSAKKNTITWSASLNSSYVFTKTTTVQINANYRSERLTPQGRYLPSFVFNLGARQDVFHKKGAITFTVSDLFETQRQEAVLSSTYLSQHVLTRNNGRVAYLGFNYNFGIVKKKKDLQFDNSL